MVGVVVVDGIIVVATVDVVEIIVVEISVVVVVVGITEVVVIGPCVTPAFSHIKGCVKLQEY